MKIKESLLVDEYDDEEDEELTEAEQREADAVELELERTAPFRPGCVQVMSTRTVPRRPQRALAPSLVYALSVRQPYAEQIASGRKLVELRGYGPECLLGRELLVVASATTEPGGEGLPTSRAVALVKVARLSEVLMLDPLNTAHAWHLTNVRRVTSGHIRGSAALYKVPRAAFRLA